MKDKDVARYKAQLESRRDELMALSEISSDSRAAVALDQQSVGRLSRMDAMQGQQMAQAQERQRRAELMRIEQALSRIAEGDFGYCEDCGDEIALKRLDVDPSVRFCIRCAS